MHPGRDSTLDAMSNKMQVGNNCAILIMVEVVICWY